MKNGHGIMALAAGLLLLLPLAGQAEEGITYLELEEPLRDPIPADCATWHELYPQFCVMHHQTAYEDNNDGVISACDYIYLGEDRYHIEWVGPTYLLEDFGYYEPLDTWEPGSPVCQEWMEIHPDHGRLRHVVEWEDGDQNGEVSPCDLIVFDDGTVCHVADVNLNIRVVPDGSPAGTGTWSKVKSLFGRLF